METTTLLELPPSPGVLTGAELLETVVSNTSVSITTGQVAQLSQAASAVDAQARVNMLAGQLASPGGAAQIGNSTISVASIKDLLTAPHDSSKTMLVAAYYPGVYATANPSVMGGAGRWVWDSNVPKANHNGGTITSPTVPWDGTQATLAAFLTGTGETAPGGNGCFVLSANTSVGSKGFGARGDNATNDTVALQKYFDAMMRAGLPIHLESGVYLTYSPLLIDNSASSSYLDTKKIDFFGDGIQSSRIVYLGTTGNALSVVGGSGAGTLPMICMQKFSGFTLIGTAAAGTIGLSLDTTSEIKISDVQINSFDLGMNLLDVDFASFDKMIIQFNNRGVLGQERYPRAVNSTRPNSIDFRGCKIGGNGLYGAHFLGGSCINFYSGHIEGNGQNNGASGWGIKAEGCGVQGGVGINLNGVYFEANQGIADVWVVAVDPPLAGLNPYHCVHTIQSCDMHRVGSTQFVTNNVKVSINSANAGKQKVVIRDGAFKGFGSYVPNAGRLYVAYDVDARNAANSLIEGCIMQDDVESVPQLEFYNTSVAINAVQSIPNAALTTVSFNTENFDADNLFVIGSPTVITVPVTGKYQVSGCANFQSNAVGARIMRIVSNAGTELVTSSMNAVTGGNPTYCTATKDVQLTKGDTISMRVYQDSTAALNLQVNSTFLSLRSVAP